MPNCKTIAICNQKGGVGLCKEIYYAKKPLKKPEISVLFIEISLHNIWRSIKEILASPVNLYPFSTTAIRNLLDYCMLLSVPQASFSHQLWHRFLLL